MEKWLSQRLTPAKAKESRWLELATVLEQLWEEFFDPDLSRLERLRSSYLADDSDLAKKIRQMGDYFSFEMPKEADRPIALAWRRLEIEYKDMELILRSVFRRHFGDFPVAWYPIFAPTHAPYGEGFIVGDYLVEEWKKNVAPDNYFLTSRGVVGVDKAGLYRDGISKEAFRNEAYPLVMRTKPLHIVFEGFLWFIHHELGPFKADTSVFWDAENFLPLLFGPLGARYDFTAADERRVDIDVFQTKRDIERPVEFSFLDPDNLPWHLDMFLPQGFGDILPIDLLLRGQEGKLLTPFSTIYAENAWRPTIADFATVKADILREEIARTWQAIAVQTARTGMGQSQERQIPVMFHDERPAHLDMFYPDAFCDWLPADLTVRGNEEELLKPFSLPFAERDTMHRVYYPVPDSIAYQTEHENELSLGLAPFTVGHSAETERELNAISAFCEDEIPLDRLPCFDGISGDFAPLDYPYGGYV